MTPPGTFERVYAAIKQGLREGLYQPGDRLEPAALSDELNASVTPIRDALHRLTGEHMVEAPRHEGFRVPMMTELMLRHLYAWHLDILLVSLARRKADRKSWSPDRADGQVSDRRPERTLASIAAVSGNPENAQALRNVSERLDAYRRLENVFLDNVEQEMQQIVTAIERRDFRTLRKALVQYHRRRQRIVPNLVTERRVRR
ncbi:MAG TPA: GntR family transcriptional regulator [Sphingomicrobium sp.]|nr:GntR family transcriptional regulator [Sphingomicrobium sp.]